MCTHRMHAAGTVRKMVHTNLMLVNFYVAEEIVCKAETIEVQNIEAMFYLAS